MFFETGTERSTNMPKSDLGPAGRLLQEVVPEPQEMARLERTVLATNASVLAAARDRLAFEDEPVGYELAVLRTRAS